METVNYTNIIHDKSKLQIFACPHPATDSALLVLVPVQGVCKLHTLVSQNTPYCTHERGRCMETACGVADGALDVGLRPACPDAAGRSPHASQGIAPLEPVGQ